MSGHILVVGSLNVDLITRVARLPHPGETVVGGQFHTAAGGKGANQAVAAARLGAAVHMIGRIGRDAFGSSVRAELERAGVAVEHIAYDDEMPTGTAQIVVDDNGQNAIAVASGANACLQPADVMHAAAAWSGAALLVLQLEIPLVTVAAAIAAAQERRLPVLLNAAPAQALPDELWRVADWLVVNEVEAEQFAGRALRTADEACDVALALRHPGHQVVVTLGEHGAVLADERGATLVPAPAVDVLDTTAAGDAFVGALAAALQRGVENVDAIRRAVVAGSLACTRLGAIPSLPTAQDVNAWNARLTVSPLA